MWIAYLIYVITIPFATDGMLPSFMPEKYLIVAIICLLTSIYLSIYHKIFFIHLLQIPRLILCPSSS